MALLQRAGAGLGSLTRKKPPRAQQATSNHDEAKTGWWQAAIPLTTVGKMQPMNRVIRIHLI